MRYERFREFDRWIHRWADENGPTIHILWSTLTRDRGGTKLFIWRVEQMAWIEAPPELLEQVDRDEDLPDWVLDFVAHHAEHDWVREAVMKIADILGKHGLRRTVVLDPETSDSLSRILIHPSYYHPDKLYAFGGTNHLREYLTCPAWIMSRWEKAGSLVELLDELIDANPDATWLEEAVRSMFVTA
jgi:hypothetical protein